MASGDTKTEALLNILGHGGTGDEYRGSGNTKTQNYILDAIDRINAIDPSGGSSAIKTLSSSDVTGKDEEDVDIIELWKLPTGVYAYKANEDYYTVANKGYDPDTSEYYINYAFNNDCLIVVSANPGDVAYCTVVSDNGVYSFIAIDEYGYTNQIFTNNTFDNELSGTVPAPTVSDANKFLRGDGSWAEAGTKVVDLTITGVSGNQVTATASEYLDDITNSGNVESYAFRIYVPEGGALPFVGNMIFRVDMYNVGESLFCYKTLYDYTNNITYHLVMWFVTINGNMHSNNVLIQIFQA